MQKIIILILSFICFSYTAYTQEEDSTILCDMPPIDSNIYDTWPWVGNNQFLLDLVDSIEGSFMQRSGTESSRSSGGTNNQMLNIPVKVWVHHPANGNNVTYSAIETAINGVNEIFALNGSVIRFYLMCEAVGILNSPYAHADANNTNAMFDTYYTPNVLNLHFPASNDGYARGRLPWVSNSKPYACYVSSTSDVKVLAHEIGHALGLPHTHNSRDPNKNTNHECFVCFQEVVSRTELVPGHCMQYRSQVKAEILGDCLSDTHADPYLRHAYDKDVILVNSTSTTPTICTFNPFTTIPVPTTQEHDINFVNWDAPNNYNAIKNIMSYSNDRCKTEFTPMQKGVEYFYTGKWYNTNTSSYVNNPLTFYSNNLIDIYENDNNKENAKSINVGDCQNHTIHRNIDPTNTDELGSSCDVDWLRLNILNNGFYTIRTNPIHGNNNIDTKLSLYTEVVGLPGVLTLLATNDDSDPNTIYSGLTHYLNSTFPNSQYDYYVKIEFNYSNSMVGDYEVCVEQHIDPSVPFQQTTFNHNVFTVSPNPSNPFTGFNVTLQPGNMMHQLFVYNSTGNLSYHETFPTPVSAHHVNTNTFQMGAYYVYVYNGFNWFGRILQIN